MCVCHLCAVILIELDFCWVFPSGFYLYQKKKKKEVRFLPLGFFLGDGGPPSPKFFVYVDLFGPQLLFMILDWLWCSVFFFSFASYHCIVYCCIVQFYVSEKTMACTAGLHPVLSVYA